MTRLPAISVILVPALYTPVPVLRAGEGEPAGARHMERLGQGMPAPPRPRISVPLAPR